MSFFEELKRRNVVRVGLAYIVIGWALAQVAGFSVETFGAPDWVLKIFVVFLGLGLPLALFLAWAYEITPDGVKREKDVDRSQSITTQTGRKLDFIIIGVLVLAVGVLLADRFMISGGPAAVAEPEPTADAVIADEVTATNSPSIAVLPFVNMSDDRDYFADGLSEELLNLLAKIPELKVAGRTSSFAFKGKLDDLRVIGDALGVNHVLEGSVRRSGDRLRITAQLIKVDDGFHLWTETYDRTMADIFDIQDDVASSISRELQLRLVPDTSGPTDNAEAYALYLQALPLVTDNSAIDTLGRVTPMLDAAIELDPQFARAHELKALIHWGNTGQTIGGAEARPIIFESASAALAIDPSLAVARLLALSSDLDYTGWAIQVAATDEVYSASPGDFNVARIQCDNLLVTGYLIEALQCAERLIELEPLSTLGYYRKGIVDNALGRTDDARDSIARAIELGGDAYAWDLAMIDLFGGDFDAALEKFENVTFFGWSPEDVQIMIDNVLGPGGDATFLDDWIAKKRAGTDNWLQEFGLYQWYLLTGDMDAFWRVIDQRFELDPSEWNDTDWLIRAGIEYPESGFTRHPRFLEFAREYGMVELWESRGPPDICSKDSGEWVCE